MIIYVDKNGKEIEKVERSTYTYVDKNTGKVLKVDGPKDKIFYIFSYDVAQHKVVNS